MIREQGLSFCTSKHTSSPALLFEFRTTPARSNQIIILFKGKHWNFWQKKQEFFSILKEALEKGYISKDKFEAMDPSDKSPGRFYELFKVHKKHQNGKTPPERPIISEGLLPTNSILVSIDMSAIYTNIPQDKGLNIVSKALEDEKLFLESIFIQPSETYTEIQYCWVQFRTILPSDWNCHGNKAKMAEDLTTKFGAGVHPIRMWKRYLKIIIFRRKLMWHLEKIKSRENHCKMERL